MNCEYLNSLIESFVKEAILDEGAIGVGSMASQGMALYITPEYSSMKRYIIYKPLTDNHSDVPFEIHGYVAIKTTSICSEKGSDWIVQNSAAEEGFGPTMYDIVMTDIYPSMLMPDRTSVSEDARGVWRYMVNNRAFDYDIIPLDKICHSMDDNPEEILNYGFKLKKQSHLYLEPLLTNHKKFMRYLDHNDDAIFSSRECQRNLVQEANKFFDYKYKNRRRNNAQPH
jgi:hypothetical protein